MTVLKSPGYASKMLLIIMAVLIGYFILLIYIMVIRCGKNASSPGVIIDSSPSITHLMEQASEYFCGPNV